MLQDNLIILVLVLAYLSLLLSITISFLLFRVTPRYLTVSKKSIFIQCIVISLLFPYFFSLFDFENRINSVLLAL